MPLRVFECPVCGCLKETLKSSVPKCSNDWTAMVEVVSAPNQKFMVAANAEKRTSKVKDSTKILTARARNHSRDHDIDETIQTNLNNGLKAQVKASLLNSKGERRKKIDDV